MLAGLAAGLLLWLGIALRYSVRFPSCKFWHTVDVAAAPLLGLRSLLRHMLCGPAMRGARAWQGAVLVQSAQLSCWLGSAPPIVNNLFECALCSRVLHAMERWLACCSPACLNRPACCCWLPDSLSDLHVLTGHMRAMRRYVLERQYTTVEGEREECPFAAPAADAGQRAAC